MWRRRRGIRAAGYVPEPGHPAASTAFSVLACTEKAPGLRLAGRGAAGCMLMALLWTQASLGISREQWESGVFLFMEGRQRASQMAWQESFRAGVLPTMICRMRPAVNACFAAD